MRPEIVAVVAAAENGTIGADGALPWHIPEDLRRFRRLTVGRPVVMGRRTFQSIGRPLPGRHNIVLTRDPGFAAEGVTVAHTLADAIAAAGLAAAARPPAICIIGGGEIYRLAMPITTAIELTRVHAHVAGDTRFPEPDPAEWRETWREPHTAGSSFPAFTFIRLERRGGLA
jgi:dihydrofolate reductase